jgi:hypothetical protein
MKKLFIPLLFASLMMTLYSCSGMRKLSITDADAASALKQMLEVGVRESVNTTFDQRNILASLFPEPVAKTLNTIQQLGVSRDLDRFTETLSLAAQKSTERSVPVFLHAIDKMSFTDALQIVKNGGTAGTDYLRSTAGTELRSALRPVMANALEEYHVNEAWNKIINGTLNNHFNLDLPNLMAGMVSEKMFQKIGETEQNIRNNSSARTTELMQRVFSMKY